MQLNRYSYALIYFIISIPVCAMPFLFPFMFAFIVLYGNFKNIICLALLYVDKYVYKILLSNIFIKIEQPLCSHTENNKK